MLSFVVLFKRTEGEVHDGLIRKFGLSSEQVAKLLESEGFMDGSQLDILPTLDYLHELNITGDQLIRLPWLLLQDKS